MINIIIINKEDLKGAFMNEEFVIPRISNNFR